MIVICLLSHRSRTGYAINNLVIKKFRVIPSTGQVYNTLVSLERAGLITCVRDNPGRAYELTVKGKKIIENLPNVVEEIHSFTRLLLQSRHKNYEVEQTLS